MSERRVGDGSGLGAGGVILLAALSGLSPLTSVFILPALPELAEDLGASLSGAQFALSVAFAGLAVGLLVVGPLSDRFGRRTPLLLGLVAYIATTVLCILATDITMLIVFRLVQGIAGGAVWVITRAVVRDAYAGRATARILSQMAMITGIAPVVAPFLSGQLLLFTNWRGLFISLAVFGVIVLGMTVFFMHETLPAERRLHSGLRGQFVVFGQFFRTPRFLAFASLGVVQSAMYFTFVIMSPFVFTEEFGMSAQQFGALFAVAALMMALGNQSNVLLLRRWAPDDALRLMLTLALAGSTAYLGVVLLHAPLPAVIAAVLLVPFAAGASNADITALTLEPYPHAAGSAAALLGACQFGIAALVPPLVSLWGASALVMSTTMLVTALGAWIIGMSRRPRGGLSVSEPIVG